MRSISEQHRQYMRTYRCPHCHRFTMPTLIMGDGIETSFTKLFFTPLIEPKTWNKILAARFDPSISLFFRCKKCNGIWPVREDDVSRISNRDHQANVDLVESVRSEE